MRRHRNGEVTRDAYTRAERKNMFVNRRSATTDEALQGTKSTILSVHIVLHTMVK